jgi:hypothetical protein
LGPANTALRVQEDISDRPGEALGDLRFRKLLSDDDWFSLPAAIRARFSKRMVPGDMTTYAGLVIEMQLSLAGRVLVHLARLIGGPFPTTTHVGAASIVAVTEHTASGGQTWTRLYACRKARPQIIHSTKMFAGATGLEEHVGGGIGMALDVRAEAGALIFRSRHYFFRLGAMRVALPKWATPGRLTVTHREEGGGRFTFTLDVVHPRLGTLIHQAARFCESKP